MENVVAGQFLSVVHLFSADDARSVSIGKFRWCDVRKSFVHICRDSSIRDEFDDAITKMIKSYTELANEMEGQSIVGTDDDEEDEVEAETNEITGEFQIEQQRRFGLPSPIQSQVHHKNCILECGCHDRYQQYCILKTEQ